MGIFDKSKELLGKLSGLKRAAEFDAAMPELASQVSAAQAKLLELEVQREDAIFEAPDTVDRLRNEIRETRDFLDDLRAAMKAAEKRQAAAAARELTAVIEARSATAAKENQALWGDYARLHEALSAAVEAIMSVRRRKLAIIEANSFIRGHGRQDLLIDLPINVIATKLNRPIADPSDVIAIQDYLPRHPDGPLLGRLEEFGIAADGSVAENKTQPRRRAP